jgi:hypothetical protein
MGSKEQRILADGGRKMEIVKFPQMLKGSFSFHQHINPESTIPKKNGTVQYPANKLDKVQNKNLTRKLCQSAIHKINTGKIRV